ncbi:hypothetical protein ITJ66_03295 [Plantibacter sp. VKM Ac-2885]|uniref:hypothetical protein n=1 Tax=unclassified Plantibacter TaxID=2624265 RepID=UPI0017842596|nr:MULTISPECIES: hypothetical protein [unclassified Plantibacter]MBD8101444.1 hypothetical protein [Plantibacter sp. CFBP 8775]MBD8518163.1 hypothetical protein [Plantibacter sp. CFBP 8804]MBD8534693.1 hypothetical protein [Plantibacter sp. CFBP 13570]MBF4511502.1 hypothetical protein [Plantibacter sp. VKM Ac-2885]
MAGTAPHSGPTHDRQASWTSEQVDAFLDEVTPHVRAFVADADGVFETVGVDEAARRELRLLLLP